MKDISSETTLGIVCYENIQGLTLALTSVLCAGKCPRTCFVYLTGEIPQFNNFYLEQLAVLARFKGVNFGIDIGPNKGIRYARDYILRRTGIFGRYLWMIDDDVIVEHDCFERLGKAITNEKHKGVAYMNGVKGDVCNRRGYQNFDLRIHDKAEDFGSFNHFYKMTPEVESFRCNTMDTGNVLLDRMFLSEGVVFSPFADTTNAGGEDALFGLQLNQTYQGRFCSTARAYHLEKEKLRFDEFSSRAEALLRSCELLHLSKEDLKREMMSWAYLDNKK
jgi:hypothetical protein